jgi:hypothetical protein
MEPNMSETKLLYRPAEVQAALAIGHSKFWSLVKSGALECRKIGTATVISAESLRAFVDGLPKA